MIAPAQWTAAIVVAGSLAVGAAGAVSGLRWRAQATRDRIALRIAEQRESAFVEAARRLSDAAGNSIEAVRAEIARAVRAIAPGIDAVMVFEEVDAELICVAASGSRVTFFDGMRCALDDMTSLLIRALRAGHHVTSRDAPDARVMHPADRFAAAIPLLLAAGRRCVLYVGGEDGGEANVAERIVRLVDQATPAYRIALERADDRASAQFDGLTGLLTARAFRTRLIALFEAARCDPSGRLSLLFIDTDRFKQWNDTYGHASGDALLRELAALLRAAATDPADVVARNGGDEFCIVFVDNEKSSAIERAERLRRSIAEADFRALHAAGSTAIDVTISASIGVACFPADAHSPAVLLEKADEAMYFSKKTGRDGVSFFGVRGELIRAGGLTDGAAIDRRRD